MDQRTREVRQDIERTRAALTSKIEMLDARVRGSVEETKSWVKRSLSPRYHVQQHPWPMMGVSMLAGYMLERFLTRRSAPSRVDGRSRADESRVWVLDAPLRREERELRAGRQAHVPSSFLYSQVPEFGTTAHVSAPEPAQAGQEQQMPGGTSVPGKPTATQQPSTAPDRVSSAQEQGQEERKPSSAQESGQGMMGNVMGQLKEHGRGVMGDMANQFNRELEMLKGAAVAAVAGLVRDMVKQAVPVAGSYAKQMADTVSTKLTGHPLETPTPGASTASPTQRTARGAEQSRETASNPTETRIF